VADAPDVTFVTCAEFPDAAGEREPVTAALRRHGLGCRWVDWDDPSVDWSATPLVMIRTTWDYFTRIDEFLAWARGVESVSTLVNSAAVLAWNTHKGYLVELAAAGVDCVPTWVGRSGDVVDQAVVGSERVIVKPAVGAGGIGLAIRPVDAVWDGIATGVDHVVQPLLTSVWADGERSVFVIDGRAIAGVAKRAAKGEIRVHEEYGGDFRAMPVPDELATAAVGAVTAATRLLGGVELPYARVDFLLGDAGVWLVSEVELVEPGLYPETVPEVVDAYASAVSGLVRRVRSEDVG
jgi:glutathione synthase/RimK-type ligase-like ATP-grasp enzyme